MIISYISSYLELIRIAITTIAAFRNLIKLIKNKFNFKDNEPEYKVLNANMSQQILKLVDRAFKSFFGLLKAKSTKSYAEKVRLPNYLKKDSHFSLIVGEFSLKSNVLAINLGVNNLMSCVTN